MNNLLGEASAQAPPPSDQPPQEGSPQATPSPSPPNQTTRQLIERALQEFDDYQRLMSQGKFAEAGQKLEQHKRTLEEIRRLNR